MIARTARSSLRLGAVWRGLDTPLVATILLLLAIGFALSLAASPAAAEKRHLDTFHYVIRHGVFATAAVAVLMVASALNERGVRRFAALALTASFAGLIVLAVFGERVMGAARWIDFGPFSLQPSEFLKPAFVVIAAWLLAEGQRGAPVDARAVVLGLYGAAALLLFAQPDIGQTALLTMLCGALLFASGLTLRWILVLGGAASALAAAAYFQLGHVRARIDAFLAGDAASSAPTQADMALNAIARGGLTGAGPGGGSVKEILPEPHTDFVFSVAVEEYGLAAALIVIGLYAFLFLRAWMLSLRLSDPFAQLATAGLALLFALQAMINIAVNLSLVPPKGMTLPFLSYGGSSMLALAFAAGLLLALTKRRPGAYRLERGR